MEALSSSSCCQICLYKTRSSSSSSSSSCSTYNRKGFVAISTYYNNCLRNFKISSNSLAWGNFYTRKIYMGAILATQGNNNVQSSAAVPGPPSGNPWRNWLVGMILSLVLPLVSNKWGRLLAIKNKVDTAVKTVETVVETVEKVADGVAHMADEMANQLPEGGKMQNIVCNIANVAEETAKDAHLVDQFIEKIEDVEEKMVDTLMGGTHTEAGHDEGIIEDNNVHSDNELDQKHDTTTKDEPQNEIIEQSK